MPLQYPVLPTKMDLSYHIVIIYLALVVAVNFLSSEYKGLAQCTALNVYRTNQTTTHTLYIKSGKIIGKDHVNQLL